MNEIEYIKKNAHKADTILRKLAFPNTSRSFAEIDDIEFVTVFEPDASFMAIYEEDKITINTHHFNCWNKKYCDKELVQVLMHELIHRFIGMWIDNKQYAGGFSGDSSPIFILFVMWFNSRLREYRIGLNSESAPTSVITIYKKEWARIFKGNFYVLFKECLYIANNFNNVLQDFNEKLYKLNEKIYISANFRFDNTQGDKDAFYSGVYSFTDNRIIIVLSARYYHHPEIFEIDLEEAVDCLLLTIDDRFIFDGESCGCDYSFKSLDAEESK